MGNASGKANRTRTKKRTQINKRTHKKYRKGGGTPSPLGKGVTPPHDNKGKGVTPGVSSPHDKRGSAPSNPTASGIAISRPSSLGGVTPSKRRKTKKFQKPLIQSILIREALKLGLPPIKDSAQQTQRKVNRNFKVTVTTTSSPKRKSI